MSVATTATWPHVWLQLIFFVLTQILSSGLKYYWMLPFCQISIIDGPNPNHSCYIDGHLICVVSKEFNEDRSKHDLHLRISLSNSYEFDSLRTSTRILIDLLRDKIHLYQRVVVPICSYFSDICGTILVNLNYHSFSEIIHKSMALFPK